MTLPILTLPILLIVDDRQQMLHYRKAALERLGYRVQTASTSMGAIKALQANQVTAVLLEYKLEGMDAEAVAFHIKQSFPQQKIVLLSAYSEVPERLLWLVDEYVMRSATLETLAVAIQAVVRKSAVPESAKRAAAASV